MIRKWKFVVKVMESPVLFILFFISNGFAQSKTDSTFMQKASPKIVNVPVAEKDINDWLKRKSTIDGEVLKNANGLKPKTLFVSALPVVGYTLQTGFAAAINASIAFYTDTASTKKISNILTSITYTQYNQVLLPIAANIWTKNNKYNIILDYRYLKYPSTTYGLGARTLETDAYSLYFNYLKIHQLILRQIHKNFYGGIGFFYDYCWDIKEINPPAGIRTSYEKYGGTSTETAAGVALKLLYDSRVNQINSSGGAYANILFRPNFTALGSDKNWQSLQIDFRKYLRLDNSKNILALWSFNWFTLGNGKPPYLLLPSTGWDDTYNTARGYIQSRFRAKNMVYAEAEYRFGLTKNGLLGGVVFANAQTFSRKLSNQLSTISPAIGTGLRIKFNKYSKTNLCIDYGFGANGSRGVFLNLGEVF